PPEPARAASAGHPGPGRGSEKPGFTPSSRSHTYDLLGVTPAHAPSPGRPWDRSEGHRMEVDRKDERSGSPWMLPGGAAQCLGIAVGTLRNWTSARYVPHARRGRVVRYHRDQIDRWLLKGACPGRATLPDLAGAGPRKPGP